MNFEITKVMKNINRRLKHGGQNAGDGDEIIDLLSPKYIEHEHRVYVDAIEQALRSNSCHNLALSGSYGSGKSSILTKVAEEHAGEAVSISLSTLGHVGELRARASKELSEEASRIQKEIVKQLLYMADPRKLSRSRFDRPHKVGFLRSLWLPSLISLILIVILLMVNKLPHIPDPPLDSWKVDAPTKAWINIVGKSSLIWILGTIALWRPIHLLSGKVKFDKLSAGPASIAFGDRSETYFDRYLDEIIYYFEATGHRIVIFEDLDRFDNPEIFEQLRSLNTVLNNAEQLRRSHWWLRRRLPIVFIYATRDSIFERMSPVSTTVRYQRENDFDRFMTAVDKAAHEVELSNRAKFFDLVIPVVPFITHRNARDALRKQMQKTPPLVGNELIDLAARHIPDYRTLVSVRREYEIYAKKIFRSGSPDLRPDALFSMILYKAVHLKDFEDIRLGSSNLDAVYAMSQKVIEHRIGQINSELDEIERRLGGDTLLTERAQELGGKLLEQVRVLSSTSGHRGNINFSLEIDGIRYCEDDVISPGPWRSLAHSEDFKMTLAYSVADPQYSNKSIIVQHSLSRKQLSSLMKEDLSVPVWEEKRREELAKRFNQLSKSRDDLRHCSMKELMAHGNDVLPSDEIEMSFADYVHDRLGSDMAADLVRHGYIDRNFALYCSTYDETALTANAMTFVLHHVEQNRPNVGYPLTEDEIKQLLLDLPIDSLGQQGCYNADILAYLITSERSVDHKYLDLLISAIVKNGEEERALLQAYFERAVRGRTETADDGSIRLVSLLASRHLGIFEILANLTGIDNRIQKQLIDVAMMSCTPDIDYRVDDVRGTIEQHYQDFDSIKNANSGSAASVGHILALSEAKLQDVTPMRDDLYKYVINNSNYSINRRNLECLAGGDALCLDVLSSVKPTMYRYALENLDEYLDALRDSAYSFRPSALCNTQRVRRVFRDLAERDDVDLDMGGDELNVDEARDLRIPTVERVLEHTDTKFSLEFVPPAVWSHLAARGNLELSMANVRQYVDCYGVDEPLASHLNQYEPYFSIEASQPNYMPIIDRLLAARKFFTPERRVELVQSLRSRDGRPAPERLQFPLAAKQIEPENSELVGLLLGAGLIEDTAETFQLTRSIRWEYRELAIAKSANFIEYMDESAVDEDAVLIINSGLISDEIKTAIASDMERYCSGLSLENLIQVAKYAIKGSVVVNITTLMWLVSSEVPASIIIGCMEPVLADLDGNEVSSMVNSLGEPYVYLTQPSGRRSVSVPDSPGHDRLLERLKSCGSVSSFKHEKTKTESHYKVFLKRK